MAKKPVNVEIYIRRGDSVERAIKRFMKKVKKEGVIDKYIKGKRYEKPSAIRHRKKMQRKRLIEQQNELMREEERNMYTRRSKSNNKRKRR